MNKERYLGLLVQLLNEHYNIIKDTNIVPQERQQYIDGYLTAARALDVIDHEELKAFVEKVHFEVFSTTIEERRAAMKIKPGTLDDYLDIPAYVRQGIKLTF